MVSEHTNKSAEAFGVFSHATCFWLLAPQPLKVQLTCIVGSIFKQELWGVHRLQATFLPLLLPILRPRGLCQMRLRPRGLLHNQWGLLQAVIRPRPLLSHNLLSRQLHQLLILFLFHRQRYQLRHPQRLRHRHLLQQHPRRRRIPLRHWNLLHILHSMISRRQKSHIIPTILITGKVRNRKEAKATSTMEKDTVHTMERAKAKAANQRKAKASQRALPPVGTRMEEVAGKGNCFVTRFPLAATIILDRIPEREERKSCT